MTSDLWSSWLRLVRSDRQQSFLPPRPAEAWCPVETIPSRLLEQDPLYTLNEYRQHILGEIDRDVDRNCRDILGRRLFKNVARHFYDQKILEYSQHLGMIYAYFIDLALRSTTRQQDVSQLETELIDVIDFYLHRPLPHSEWNLIEMLRASDYVSKLDRDDGDSPSPCSTPELDRFVAQQWKIVTNFIDKQYGVTCDRVPPNATLLFTAFGYLFQYLRGETQTSTTARQIFFNQTPLSTMITEYMKTCRSDKIGKNENDIPLRQLVMLFCQTVDKRADTLSSIKPVNMGRMTTDSTHPFDEIGMALLIVIMLI